MLNDLAKLTRFLLIYFFTNEIIWLKEEKKIECDFDVG